jgi:cell division protein FtsZ
MEDTHMFELPKHHKSIIKVIGVGGGGSNAVNHMYNQGIKDVEFVVVNTDMQALKYSPVPNKLQIGVSLTEGLGAGANPEKGRQAALESKEDVRDMLSDDTKMVFITAGMGGGTGTGAAPVIAKIARDMDILTVGIVTAPFSFEGKKKIKQAYDGIRELREACDTVLVILNDKLRDIFGNLSITSAFAQADNVLLTAAKGIAEIITVTGYINVDFEDVKTVMKNAGAAVLGSSTTEGEGRALRAAQEAISSPLLNNVEINGATKILISIISGEKAEFQMDELTEISEYIQSAAGDEAEIIFGHGIDPHLEEGIRVTVIATGFEQYDTEKNTTLKGKDDTEKVKVIDLDSGRERKPNQISLFPDDQNAKTAQAQRGVGYQPLTPGMTKQVRQPFTTVKPEIPPVENKPPVPVNEDQHEPNEDGHLDEIEGYVVHKKPVEQPAEPEMHTAAMDQADPMEAKRLQLIRAAKERMNRLNGLKSSTLSQDELKEKQEVPAYVRLNVNLKNVTPSKEKDISRYQLNEDSQIMGNNRFLHDNVD